MKGNRLSTQLSWSKESHSHDYHAQQPTQTHAQWGTWMHHDTYLHQRRQNDARGVQTHKHLHRLHKANLTTARCCVFSLRSLAGRMDTHTHTHSKQLHSRIQQGSKSSVEAPTPFRPAVWEKNVSFWHIFRLFFHLSPTFNTALKEACNSNVDFNFFK